MRSPSCTGKRTGDMTMFLLGRERLRVPFGGIEPRPCHVISLNGLLFSMRPLLPEVNPSAGATRGVSACQLADAPSLMIAPDSRVRRNVPIGTWPHRSMFCICLRFSSSLAEVCDSARESTGSGSKNETSRTSCNSMGSANEWCEEHWSACSSEVEDVMADEVLDIDRECGRANGRPRNCSN